MTLLFLVFCTVSLLNSAFSKTEWDDNPVQKPLHIGAFNVQKLGNSKLGNEKIMNIVKQVLIRYDLVLVQEIVTTNDTLMQNVVRDMNKMVSSEDQYVMQISERLGRDRAKEQYAYIYKSRKLSYIAGEAYPDKDDDFMRPPYIVHFSAPTLRDLESFIAIGIHTQPKNAANETSALADVYDYAKKRYKQTNAVFMGDMNAGCQNVRISDWDNIDLWTREEFLWLIKHDKDTTVSSNCCPYDRIVIAGSGMSDAVIWNSVNIFNFKEAYGLTTEEVLEISDHWPVEVKLRGKVSEDTKVHIDPSICLHVDDSQERTLPAELQRQKTTMGFQIDRTESTITLSIQGDEAEPLVSNFERLAAKYPQFVSNELLQSVSYKVRHGAVEDRSSNADASNRYSLYVEYDSNSQKVSTIFCADTTVN